MAIDFSCKHARVDLISIVLIRWYDHQIQYEVRRSEIGNRCELQDGQLAEYFKWNYPILCWSRWSNQHLLLCNFDWAKQTTYSGWKVQVNSGAKQRPRRDSLSWVPSSLRAFQRRWHSLLSADFVASLCFRRLVFTGIESVWSGLSNYDEIG